MFILIEGGNASGKSTIIRELIKELNKDNAIENKYIHLISPTCPFDTVWDKMGDKEIDILTKYYFFRAVAQNDNRQVKYLIKQGNNVILERSLYETEAFDLTLEQLNGVKNSLVKKHLNYNDLIKPDLTFFLDLDDGERYRRIEGRNRDNNVRYWEGREFQEVYNKIYREIAKREKFIVIDTMKNNVKECVGIIEKYCQNKKC